MLTPFLVFLFDVIVLSLLRVLPILRYFILGLTLTQSLLSQLLIDLINLNAVLLYYVNERVDDLILSIDLGDSQVLVAQFLGE